MGGPLRIGVVGVGKISEQYFAALPSLPGLELVAVGDLDRARAAQVGSQQRVDALSVPELLADPRVDAVLNLTIPAAHVEVATSALTAGKHVYGEKPLALAPEDALPMLRLAEERGLRVGSAPDTVLGTGVQTARQLLDADAIGTAIAASAFWGSPGHELWHPAPQFYYQPGGGPLFDMGPYYLSALVSMLGPVVRLSGAVGRSERERTVATGPAAGTAIPVGVDTHVTAILEHASGAASTIVVSFDVWATRNQKIEVYGTAGTLAVPDPNNFSDPVWISTSSDREWREAPVSAGYVGAGRGYGLADMARAIETDRPHRASGVLAFHVLEIMDTIIRAAHDHTVIAMSSTVDRPEPVPADARPDTW